MKKILHIILISCFSFTITSCAEIIVIGAAGGAAYWYKDDISNKYDEFSKESDETEKTDAQVEQTTDSTISEKTPSSLSFLFLLVEKELSLPHRMEPNGLKGLLDQRVNSEQSPTVRIPWWWLVFPEPSSPHRMEPNGL